MRELPSNTDTDFKTLSTVAFAAAQAGDPVLRLEAAAALQAEPRLDGRVGPHERALQRARRRYNQLGRRDRLRVWNTLLREAGPGVRP